MTPEKCPGCGTKLNPDMLACPNCPMSFPEDDGPQGVSNPLKQSRYYQFLLPVAFFGGLAWLVWSLAVGYLHLGEENIAKSETPNIMNEKPIVPGSGAAALREGAKSPVPGADPGTGAGAGAAAGAAASGPDAGSESGSSTESDGVLIISHVGEGSPSAPAPAPKPVREWKLRGVVYDLTTLKPVAGAALDFKDEETNRVVKTRTDSAGRYRTIVPPLSGDRGYAVAVAKRGYASNYLDPSIAGVKTLSPAKRLEMARGLSETLTAASASVAAPSEAPFVTDFYLAPRP